MKHNKLNNKIFIVFILLFSITVKAQEFIPVNNQPSSFLKAMELYQSANYVAAEKQLIDLATITPIDDPIIYDLDYYRLMCLVKQNKRTVEAEITTYLKKENGSPWENQLWFELARLQFNNKKYRPAANTFKKVEPSQLSAIDLADYKFYNAYSNMEAGNLKGALQGFYDVKRGKSIYATSAAYYWAYINYLEGNYETALEEFSKLENNPKFAGFISYYTIQIYYLQEKYDIVIQRGDKLIASAPEVQKNELNKILGDSYYETGQYIRAIGYLDEYKGVGGKRTREDYYRLAYCYFQIKDYKNAISGFDKVTLSNDEMAQNAYYHLADCFLELNDKNKARVAFERASQFDYDPKIAEDALFNYAKLTYELSYSPFNETIKAFDDYISKYPNSERNDAAFSYLVKVYMTTKNYKDAISSIEKIKVKSPAVKEALQRVTYYRALELFNDGYYAQSITFFYQSLQNETFNRTYKALSLYWSAEAKYRLRKYNEAKDLFIKFQSSPGAFSLNEFGIAYYNIAYCYIEQKMHNEATTWFRKYLSQSKVTPKLKADALNRLGDCYYINSDYKESAKYYSQSIDLKAFDPDYALLQRASCYGIDRSWDEKNADLQNIITNYPNSSYTDDAYFELARTYERQQNNDQAISTYSSLAERLPQSSYVKKAYLQLGLIYYNKSDYKNSLVNYKKVVENYPNTDEAKAAMVGIKNNYIEMNDVDGYFAYAKKIGSGTNLEISATSQDSLFYMAAEKNYMSGGSNPGAQFEEYLKRYPEGSFQTSATFYLAETYYEKGEFSKSLKLYEDVSSISDNIFTEQALIKSGELTFNATQYQKSLEYFTRLEKIASTKWNILKARAGMMRNFYQLEQWNNTVNTAISLLGTEKVTELMSREANFKLAKSYYNLKQFNDALKYFTILAQDVKSAEGAESKYLKARILFNNQDFDASEKEILNFIDINTPHQYWLANSFILLSDIYLIRNDAFQAKHTLKSILENYTNTTDGIIDEASRKLKLIEDKEKESILNNEQPADSTLNN